MKFSKYIMLAAAVTGFSLGMASCQDDAHSDLQGIYAAPSTATVTGATLSDKTKEGNLRTFTIAFNTQEGVAINMALVTNQYYLSGNGYSIKDASAAKNGNYVSGKSTVNGSAVTDGTFSITQAGDDYTISNSVLFTADGKAYKISGKFTMSFEPDDPTAINVLKGVQNNGNGTYTVVFSTGGYTENFNMTTYQMEYSGEGNDLQIIFNLPDGKLQPGTYSPGSGYVAGYSFMNNAYEAWGVPAFEDYGGSLWYTIANGAKTPALVTSGDIVVKKDGPMYTILLDQGKGGVYAQYTGAISDLDPDGGGNVAMMTTALGVTNWASFGWGVNLIDINLGDGNVSQSYDAATQQTTYAGSGNLLQVEVFSADGVLKRGEYTIAAQGAEGVCLAGAENAYSPGNPGGTYVRKVTDGQLGEWTYITEGTLTVEGEGDDTKITLTTGDVTYMFTGNLGL